MNKMETIKVMKENLVGIAYWFHYYEKEATITEEDENKLVIVTPYGSVVKRDAEEVKEAIKNRDELNIPIMAFSLVDYYSDYRLLDFGDDYKLVSYLIKFIDDLKKKAKDEIDAM